MGFGIVGSMSAKKSSSLLFFECFPLTLMSRLDKSVKMLGGTFMFLWPWASSLMCLEVSNLSLFTSGWCKTSSTVSISSWYSQPPHVMSFVFDGSSFVSSFLTLSSSSDSAPTGGCLSSSKTSGVTVRAGESVSSNRNRKYTF